MSSCNMNQQPNRYVMSLDSLDISLLPTTYYSRLKSKDPYLWNFNDRSGRDNDYYQFEIKPKAEATISEIDSVDDASQETTICYICNTKVPLPYIVDHENSLKHKAFAKIAEVVLNRARQHMLKGTATKNVKRTDSMHFCAPCVVVVSEKDRKRHEKSVLHKRSVSLDRLLHELVAIYTEDADDAESGTESTDKSVDSNANKKVQTNSDFDTNTVVISDIDPNANAIKSGTNSDFDTNTVVISDNNSSLRKNENDRERVNDFDVQMEYIRLIDQYDTEKLNTLTPENGNIRIETQDGFVVVVSEDNFHGFTRVSKRHVQCKICKVIVKDEQEHKTSEEHIRKIVKPFEDKHCVRNLDNSWSHCVICNAIIDNSDVHALCNKSHEKLLQEALRNHEDLTYTTTTTQPNYAHYCSTCNISIHTNDVYTHMNGYRHTMLLKAVQESDQNFVNPNDSKDPKPSNDAIKSNKQTSKEINMQEQYCATCNIIINVNSLDSHINGKKHTMNLKSPLHYVMKLVDESQELICRVCSVYVIDSPVHVKSHVDTLEHQSKLKDFLEANYVIEEADRFYCKPCHVFIMKMNEFYHIEKYSHEMNLIALREKEERGVSYDQFKLCHICDVLIPNNPDSIEKHNDGERHKTNIAQVGKEIAEFTKADVIHKPQTTAKLHHEMNETVNPRELKCKICEVLVPNKQENIDEHVKGTRHKSNLRALMEDNLIELINGRYYCDPCKVVVATEKELMHIERPKHKKKLARYKSNNNQTSEGQTVAHENEANATPKTTAVAKSVQKNVPTAVAKVANNETVDLYLLLKHHFLNKGDLGLECMVCKITILPNTEEDAMFHARQIDHSAIYNKILTEHLMFESDNGVFFCGICKCLVPAKGELVHLSSPKHKNKRVQLIENTKYCVECDISTVGRDMEEHIASSKHIVNLKQKQKFLHHCEDCGELLMKNSPTIDYHKENCLLWQTHRLVVKNKVCYCMLCDMYLTKNQIDDHIPSPRHMMSIGLVHN